MELTNFQKRIGECALKTSGSGKHAVRSAIRHMERSWQLADSMPEVSAFLAITAEEEAATAVFHALKKRKYIGADRLNPRCHRHKNALMPFVRAVQKVFKPFIINVTLNVGFARDCSEGQPPLIVAFNMQLDKENITAQMPYPLHLFAMDSGSNVSLADSLAEVATERGASNIIKYIEKAANLRNKTLYASPKSIPTVHFSSGFLTDRQRDIYILITLYLLIEPYDQIQHLAQHTLTTFLQVLTRDKSKTDESMQNPAIPQ